MPHQTRAAAPEEPHADEEARTHTAATPLLQLTGIEKRWPGATDPVLDCVDLVLASGEVISISGRNGAGKTTLLRIVAGIVAPDAGEVSLGGVRLGERGRAYWRQVGFVSAGNAGLYARLTVDDHLRLCARLALLRRSRRAAAIDAMLAAFELDELRGRRVDRLSMGQRQRLRLATGFLHDPAVVLLDEPQTSLDLEATALLEQALEKVRGRGGAAVICSPTGSPDFMRFDRRCRVAGGRIEDE